MTIFLRDSDGDLYIEVPGRPGRFASTAEFQRGVKYVEQYNYSREEIEEDGPAVEEWSAS